MGNNNQEETVDQTQGVQGQQEQQTQGTQTAEQQEGTQSVADLMKKLAELEIDNRKLKKANDNLASENGGLRKQVNAKLTVEEQKATQQAEEVAELNERLKKAEQTIAFNDAVKRFMTLGMDEAYATKVAQLEMDGDKDMVNSTLKSFIDSEKQKVKETVTADIYAKMPTPVSGNGDGQIDYNKVYQDKLNAGDVEGAIQAQLQYAQQKAQTE